MTLDAIGIAYGLGMSAVGWLIWEIRSLRGTIKELVTKELCDVHRNGCPCLMKLDEAVKSVDELWSAFNRHVHAPSGEVIRK